MMKIISFSILLIILCSCEVKKLGTEQDDIIVVELTEREQKAMQEKMRLDSINHELEWKEVRDGLYINKNREIGFQVYKMLSEKEGSIDYFTNFCDDERTPYKDVIDTGSFKCIGGGSGWGGYYKDKNHIYHFFGTSGGGVFKILEEADHATFKILEDCYGIDKNHVYHMRDGMMDEVDAATFKVVSNKHSCLAKDKNGYYNSGDQPLSEEELAAPELQKLKKKLDRK